MNRLKLFCKINHPQCLRSHWLRWHHASVVNNMPYCVISKSTTRQTHVSIVNNYRDTCQCSQRLCQHTVDSFTLEKKKLRTKETKKLIWFLTYCFLTLQSYIFAKTKHFGKPFLPVHIGPRSNLLSQNNDRKSSDTVPLRCFIYKKPWTKKIMAQTC